jgi:P4 family phage/plasmid primase-like protien
MNIIARISQNFPAELLAMPNWVCWKLRYDSEHPAKRKKIPYNPSTGRAASSTDPTTWTSFQDAADAYRQIKEGYSGLGFCFPLDGSIVGIDLDNKAGPQLNPDVMGIAEIAGLLKALPTYTEISPSGTGLHLFLRPRFSIDIEAHRFPLPCGWGFEMYDKGRFFTVTGQAFYELEPKQYLNADYKPAFTRWSDSLGLKGQKAEHKAIEQGQEPKAEHSAIDCDQAELFRRAKSDNKLASLWAGDLSHHADNASNADFALTLKLAFYTGGDAATMDALFRQSGLMRDKWDKVHVKGKTYGAATLENALKSWDGNTWQSPAASKATKTPKAIAKPNSTGGGESVSTTQPPIEPVPATKSEPKPEAKETEADITKKTWLPPQSQIASRLLKDLGQLAYDETREDWMRYQDNHWQVLDKRSAMRCIQSVLDKAIEQVGYSASYLRGVASFIEMAASLTDWDSNPDYLPFANGVLRLSDRNLLPHNPAHRLTWQVPYDYQPNGDATPFVTWLLQAVGDHQDQVQLLRAYMNCVLVGRPEFQRYLELIGPGGTGKGSFIRVVEMLVGHQNCHSTELKHLENNRFETAKLYGKRLVTITDTQNYAGDVSVLKAMTGQDTLRFEEKNKQAGNGFRFGGMLLIAANEPIASKDYTSGIARRRITILFNHQVKAAERRDLEAEFAPLIPAIVNWVLTMPADQVRNYMVQTDEAVPSLASASRDNLLAVNPLAPWLDENVIYDQAAAPTQIGGCWRVDGQIEHRSDWLYPNYVDFCEGSGIRPLALNRFVNLLLELCRSQLELLHVDRYVTKLGKHITALRLRCDYDELGSPIDEKYPRKTIA